MANIYVDPVCSMPVSNEEHALIYPDQEIYFCSDFCKQKFRLQPDLYFTQTNLPQEQDDRHIAYFSMEIGLDSNMPTYSGGLGILAGDFLKSCADLKIPIIAVSLLYKKGYFNQHLDTLGNQQEIPVMWKPSLTMRPLATKAQIVISDIPVTIQAWQCDIIGNTGSHVPLILLDTDVAENQPWYRELTYYLYGGDQRYRLAQEIILGIGGVRMLRALGYNQLRHFHMNEGHSSLLTLELLQEQQKHHQVWDFNAVREQCIFTTHTPVPAGHDQFSYTLVKEVLGNYIVHDVLTMLGGDEFLNMTLLGLNSSKYTNGVAKKHGETSKQMFPHYPIDSITNGVYSVFWTCDSFKTLYDEYIPGWRKDPFTLRHTSKIPLQEIWDAHTKAKAALIHKIQAKTNRLLNLDVFTVGFARRATLYKRADLIFSQCEKLLEITRQAGPIQLVFAGKAHPKDTDGKEIIKRIYAIAEKLKKQITIIYLENYDIELGQLLTSGVDLWLNTPLRPLEASGTSGMKAAHNGVPSLSALDGWWLEGHLEGITGWSIGTTNIENQTEMDQKDAEDIYYKLGNLIIPMYYNSREKWIEVMKQTIAINASFFNTHRMVQQYVTNAYL